MKTLAVLYIVTCGADHKFVKFMTERLVEAKAARCTINRPTTIHAWDGVRHWKIKK